MNSAIDSQWVEERRDGEARRSGRDEVKPANHNLGNFHRRADHHALLFLALAEAHIPYFQDLRHFLRIYQSTSVSSSSSLATMASKPPLVLLFGYTTSTFTYKIKYILKLKQIPYTFIPVPTMMLVEYLVDQSRSPPSLLTHCLGLVPSSVTHSILHIVR